MTVNKLMQTWTSKVEGQRNSLICLAGDVIGSYKKRNHNFSTKEKIQMELTYDNVIKWFDDYFDASRQVTPSWPTTAL